MKVIIPLAGKGTRLRPHTHITPKPMLRIAGKPVIDYVMDDLKKLGGVEEVIYITGHLKEKVEEYTRTKYPWKSVFVEQKEQRGTADAIALARPYVDQPVMIIFVDTIFDADLGVIKRTKADGIIWTKEVEDYQRFGVVVTDKDGFMTKIVEKPKEPISRQANIGLQYIENWKLMFEGIDHVLRSPPNKGEFYLTDAFQYMVDKGAKLKVEDVEGWYDAGKLDTLLETNRIMLEKRKMARRPRDLAKDASIVEPVYIEDGAKIARSTIGPNVSISAGTVIEDSTLRDTIVGTKSRIVGSQLHDSLVGDEVVVEGLSGELTIGDHSEIRATGG
ncbi:MAG TPA: sugar phosphate nucleotidyltransferase [Gemmatimonadaceae bacterium]|nr:sugar phosphate nucleotidyltransferase [Gemmatimonadaceae bacterium]